MTKSRLHSLVLDPNCHLHCVSASYSCPGSCSGYLYCPICLGSSPRHDAWAVLGNKAQQQRQWDGEPPLHGGIRAYPRKRLRYCRLQVDQENTPLFPAKVGDMMFPSVLRQGFPSPSWIIPKLKPKHKEANFQTETVTNIFLNVAFFYFLVRLLPDFFFNIEFAINITSYHSCLCLSNKTINSIRIGLSFIEFSMHQIIFRFFCWNSPET